MNIHFKNELGVENYPPLLASDILPLWYKKTKSYMNNTKTTPFVNGALRTTATIKKCMPIFDVMTSGYFITTWSDIKISKQNGSTSYEITEPILQDHSTNQAQGHPFIHITDDVIAKFMNTWGIKTPEGYSCLFIPPSHHPNILNIFPAIVDTDTYNLAIHFPLYVSNKNFEGKIKKGTPIVQVIPYKREQWHLIIEDLCEKERVKLYQKLHAQTNNRYKKQFWTHKEYV